MGEGGRLAPHKQLIRVDVTRQPRKTVYLGERKPVILNLYCLALIDKNGKVYGSKS